MIRVTIELIPFGVGKPKLLNVIEIANDGSGDIDRGNYKARVGRRGVVTLQNEWIEKVVRAFPRRSKNVVHMLARALTNMGYK